VELWLNTFLTSRLRNWSTFSP